MDPLTIAGLISGVGALAGGAFGWLGSKETNKSNRRIAREQMSFEQGSADKQMAYQERMSSTAFQRARADMAAAGINPMLAANQGGSSTPSGSSARGAGFNRTSQLLSTMSSAVEVARATAVVEHMMLQNELLRNKVPESRWQAAMFKTAPGVTLKAVESLVPGLTTGKSLLRMLRR